MDNTASDENAPGTASGHQGSIIGQQDKDAGSKGPVTEEVTVSVTINNNLGGDLFSGFINKDKFCFILCKSMDEAKALETFLSGQPDEIFVKPFISLEHAKKYYVVVEDCSLVFDPDLITENISRIIDMAIYYDSREEVHGNLVVGELVAVKGMPKIYRRPLKEFSEIAIHNQTSQIVKLVDHLAGVEAKVNKYYKNFRRYLSSANTIVDLHSLQFHPFMMSKSSSLYSYCDSMITVFFEKMVDDHKSALPSFTDLINAWNEAKHCNEKKLIFHALTELEDRLQKICPNFLITSFQYMHEHGWNAHFRRENHQVSLLLKRAKEIFSERGICLPSLLKTCKTCQFLLAKFDAKFKKNFGSQSPQIFIDVTDVTSFLVRSMKIVQESPNKRFRTVKWSSKTVDNMTKLEKAILDLLSCVYFFIELLRNLVDRININEAVYKAAVVTLRLSGRFYKVVEAHEMTKLQRLRKLLLPESISKIFGANFIISKEERKLVTDKIDQLDYHIKRMVGS